MKVWIISVLVLFGVVEMYQWTRHFTLPLPVFILCGALLAIASNYKKYTVWFLQQQPNQSDTNRVQTPTLGELTNTPKWSIFSQHSTLPATEPTRPISFIISPRTQEEMRNNSKG